MHANGAGKPGDVSQTDPLQEDRALPWQSSPLTRPEKSRHLAGCFLSLYLHSLSSLPSTSTTSGFLSLIRVLQNAQEALKRCVHALSILIHDPSKRAVHSALGRRIITGHSTPLSPSVILERTLFTDRMAWLYLIAHPLGSQRDECFLYPAKLNTLVDGGQGACHHLLAELTCCLTHSSLTRMLMPQRS